MRIIGGSRKGLRLAGLDGGDERARLRPTSDRVRESIFNLLVNAGLAGPLDDLRVLDLFAGTGALGLEALSRGAAHASFVERGAKALTILRANVARMQAEDHATILRRDATRPGPPAGPPADLVFLDPPYGRGLGERALVAALAEGWIAPGARIVWEEGRAMTPPAGFTLDDARQWGGTWVGFLSAPPGA